MRLIVWVLATLPAIIAACPSFLPRAFDSTTSYRDNNATIARRWTEYVTHPRNFAKEWPRWLHGETKIRYCFADPYQRQMLLPFVRAALKLWFDHLGFPGATSGHSLSVVEHPHRFCFFEPDVTNPDGSLMWDPRIQAETVRIVINPLLDRSASATPGYSDGAFERHVGDPLAGRHHIFVSLDLLESFDAGDIKAVPTLAHEFGHIFGLEHEHQRADRDHYISFDCSGIGGYAQKAAEVQARGQHTMDQVCSDPLIAREYDWANMISAFAKTDFILDDEGLTYEFHRKHGVEYDYSSIMHYRSAQAASYWPLWPFEDWSLAKAPLRRWKKGSPHFSPPAIATDENSELMFLNVQPSRLDVEAIKHLYPW